MILVFVDLHCSIVIMVFLVAFLLVEAEIISIITLLSVYFLVIQCQIYNARRMIWNRRSDTAGTMIFLSNHCPINLHLLPLCFNRNQSLIQRWI